MEGQRNSDVYVLAQAQVDGQYEGETEAVNLEIEARREKMALATLSFLYEPSRINAIKFGVAQTLLLNEEAIASSLKIGHDLRTTIIEFDRVINNVNERLAQRKVSYKPSSWSLFRQAVRQLVNF